MPTLPPRRFRDLFKAYIRVCKGLLFGQGTAVSIHPVLVQSQRRESEGQHREFHEIRVADLAGQAHAPGIVEVIDQIDVRHQVDKTADAGALVLYFGGKHQIRDETAGRCAFRDIFFAPVDPRLDVYMRLVLGQMQLSRHDGILDRPFEYDHDTRCDTFLADDEFRRMGRIGEHQVDDADNADNVDDDSADMAESRVGKPITVSGPLGKFMLDDSDRPMLCVAGGSGMSAIFAILEHAAARNTKRDAVFLYGARTQKDLYMLDEIRQFEKHWHPDAAFSFIPVLSEEPEDSDWQGARGFVADHMARHCLGQGGMQPDDIVAYFCGPPPMINMGVDLLAKAGVPAESIRYDKFEDATSPAPVIDNSKCVLCDECLLVKPLADCIVEVSALYPKDRRHVEDGRNAGFASYRRISPLETSGLYYNSLYIDENECIRCYACVDICPADAIDPNNDKAPRTLRRIIA